MNRRTGTAPAALRSRRTTAVIAGCTPPEGAAGWSTAWMFSAYRDRPTAAGYFWHRTGPDAAAQPGRPVRDTSEVAPR